MTLPLQRIGAGTLAIAVLCWLAPVPASAAHDGIVACRAQVVARYPHDAAAFTQGLLYYDGYLYESTGLFGRSSVRRVGLASGRVWARNRLRRRYFGEGLARVGQRLVQLTWKAGVAFVYALPGLERIDVIRYPGQGWGLTWNGSHLIMSDGSAVLRFVEPHSFRVQRRLKVTRAGVGPVDSINELEYIRGRIWANVRHRDKIIRIDPDTGRVTGVIAAGHLRKRLPETAGVLNGIAWDAAGQRLFITGKNWPAVFQIRVPCMNLGRQ